MNDLLQKVKKLFNLSNGTTNEGEAQAAILAAQRLMAKHRITLEDLKLDETFDDEEIQHESIEKSGRIQHWKSQLIHILADNFRCKLWIRRYLSTIPPQTCAMVTGRVSDIETLREVYRHAVKEATYYCRIWKKRNPGSKSNDYYWGFVLGLEERFKRQVSQNQWQLIVRPDPGVQEAYENLQLLGAKTPHQPVIKSEAALVRGYSDGLAFSPTIRKTEQEETILIGENNV